MMLPHYECSLGCCWPGAAIAEEAAQMADPRRCNWPGIRRAPPLIATVSWLGWSNLVAAALVAAQSRLLSAEEAIIQGLGPWAGDRL